MISLAIIFRFPKLYDDNEIAEIETEAEKEERQVAWTIINHDPLEKEVEIRFTKPRRPSDALTESFSTAANASDEPQFDPTQVVGAVSSPFDLGHVEVEPFKYFPTSAPCTCSTNVNRTCFHCTKMRKTLMGGFGGVCGVLTEMLLSVQAAYPRVLALMEYYVDANGLMCNVCYFPKGGKRKKSKTGGSEFI